MSRIPQTPPSNPVVPQNNRRRVDVPTYSGGQLTPRENLTMPNYNTQALGMVEQLTNTVTDIDRTIATDIAKTKGEKAQSISKEYVGNRFNFSLTGQAYKQGVDAKFVSQKETELENELLKLRSDFLETTDTAGYTKAAENYKNKFMSAIPEQFFGDFNTYFDKKNTLNITQLEIKKREKEMIDGSFQLTEQNKTIADRIAQNIRYQGISTSETLIDDFAILNRNNKAQKDIFGLSLEDRTKLRSEQKRIISEGAAAHVYEQIKDTPGAYDAWIDQIAKGEWNVGDLGDEDMFSKVMPGGVKLNRQERQSIISYVESLRKQDKSNLARLSAKQKNTAQANNTQLLATGWDNFRRSDGSIDKTRALFDYDSFVANGGDPDVAQDLQDENDVAIFAAEESEIAKSGSTTSIQSQITKLRSEIQVVNDLELTDHDKNIYIKQRTKAIEMIQAIQDTRSEVLKNGGAVDYMITQNKITTTGLDTYEGQVNAMTQAATLTNQSVYQIGPSETQSVIEYDKLGSAIDNKDYNSFIRFNNDMINRQRSLVGSMISVAHRKGNADTFKYVDRRLSERARRNPTHSNTKLLFNVRANYEESFQNGYTKDSADTENKQAFFKSIQDGLYEFDNDFGTAVKAEYDMMYDYYRTKGNSASEAAKKSKDFVMNGLVEIETEYNTLYVSYNQLMGEFEASQDASVNEQQLQMAKKSLADQINSTYNRPEEHNLTVLGKSIDDWVGGDRDGYKAVMIGNTIKLVTKESGSLTKFTVLTKRPSAYNTMFYTDLSVPVRPESEMATAYEDESTTWEYDHTVDIGKFKEPKTVKRLQYDVDALDETNLTQVEGSVNATLDDKAVEFWKFLEKNGILKQNIEDGVDYALEEQTVSMIYEDPFSTKLFPTSVPDQAIAHGISMAFAQNKGQPWMVQWLMSKSDYLTAGRDPRSSSIEVVKLWNDNFDKIKNLTTNTDTPVRMDVLQALVKTIKDNPGSSQYDTEIDIDTTTVRSGRG
jgi:hypothetical protein